MPSLSAANCAELKALVTPSVPSSKVPSAAFIAVPPPLLQLGSSMKNSAATTFVVASVSVAVTVGAVLVGDEETAVAEVTGPVVSLVKLLSLKVEVPKLVSVRAALSVAREWIVYEPSLGGVKLYDQRSVPLARFHVSLALLNPVPSQ